jgi:O-antigen/teichoic acid export membrane protein
MQTHFGKILTHGKNYLIASLASKALAFISIPVYTRLLSPNDYGTLSIINGVVAILICVMALSMDRSISRYYFDKVNLEDFRQFTGTSIIISIVAFFISSFILFFFAQKFGEFVGLEKKSVYLIIPLVMISIVALMFEQVFGPQKESKIIAMSSLYRVYACFGLSVIVIFLLNSNKYYGALYSQIIIGFAFCYYWIKKLKPFVNICFKFCYVKYIWTYSVPLIPYVLSSIIIEQFGRIALGTQSMSQAGYYSLAQSIGSLVGIIIVVTHQAWNPYYFEYMNSKNYSQLDSDFIRIFKLSILVAFTIAYFGDEIGMLLAKREFTGSLYLVPIFAIGYLFYQLAYIYLRNFMYSKSTYLLTLSVLLSSICNIVLNVVLMKTFGELGLAISFLFAYIILAVISWAFNKYIIKLHTTPLNLILKSLLYTMPFWIFQFLINKMEYRITAIVLKLVLLLIISLILFWSERKIIYTLYNKYIYGEKH